MAVINSVDNKVSKMKQCICAVLVFNTLMVSLFSGHLYIAYIRVSQDRVCLTLAYDYFYHSSDSHFLTCK